MKLLFCLSIAVLIGVPCSIGLNQIFSVPVAACLSFVIGIFLGNRAVAIAREWEEIL